METGTLNFENFDPAHEINVTKSLLTESAASGAVVSQAATETGSNAPTDYKGRSFDPAIHLADENGKPIISNGNIRIKKGAWNKIKDFVSGKNENEKSDFANKNADLPRSDHEIDVEIRQNLNEATAQADRMNEIEANAGNAAELYFVGGAMVLGPEFYNQRDRFYERVKKHLAVYEEKTGRSVDLPPGAALAIGLSSVTYEIIKKEPECKKRFDVGAAFVRKNAGNYMGKIFTGKGTANPETEKEKGTGEYD